MSDENTEYQKNVNEQSGVEGQRKEVRVENNQEAVNFAQLLKNMEFPARKSELIHRVKMTSDNNEENSKVIKKLESIEDKQYENVAQVTQAAGLVR